MPWFDLPLDELRTHRTRTEAPPGLDDFWREAIDAARQRARPPVSEPYRPDLYGAVAVDDLTFSGADGHPIRAWFLRPRRHDGGLACLVRFIGYGGGRGLPIAHLQYAAAGHALLVMDTRGQGGHWTCGATGDPAGPAAGPEHPGVMTRGLHDPREYYYRRLYVDAVRAVETARDHPEVDGGRVAVGGTSQGGALALASAALLPDAVRLCCADVPYMCDIARAIGLASEHPFLELVDYLHHHPWLVEQAHHTVAHVDCAILAPRIRARTIVGVGLMDTICPPSTVFAAYNAMEAEKEIVVMPYGGHESPDAFAERQLEEFARMAAG